MKNKQKIIISIAVVVIVLLAVIIGFFVNKTSDQKDEMTVIAGETSTETSAESGDENTSDSDSKEDSDQEDAEYVEDIAKIKEVLDDIDAEAYWAGRDCGSTTYTENGYTYSYSGVTSGVLLKTDGTKWYEYLGDEYLEPWSEITAPKTTFNTMTLDEATSIITNLKDESWLASITGVCDRSDARLYFENWLDDNGYSLVVSNITVYSHDSTSYCIAYTRFGDVYAFISTDGGQTYTKVDCNKKEATRILKHLNNIDWSLRHGYTDSSIEQGPKYYE